MRALEVWLDRYAHHPIVAIIGHVIILGTILGAALWR